MLRFSSSSLRVFFTKREDRSTSRMISIFSRLGISHITPDLYSKPTELFLSTLFFRDNSATSCLSCSSSFFSSSTSTLVASRTVSPNRLFFPASRKSFAPSVIKVGIYPFHPTDGIDAFFSSKPLKDDADLFFCWILLPDYPPDLSYDRFGKILSFHLGSFPLTWKERKLSLNFNTKSAHNVLNRSS